MRSSSRFSNLPEASAQAAPWYRSTPAAGHSTGLPFGLVSIRHLCGRYWHSFARDLPASLPSLWTTKSSKLARLTCHSFCNLSSHLILPVVNVSMNPLSLKRLQDVSRHPLISKGVQFIQIHTTCFNSEMASDLGLFTGACVDDLRGIVRHLTRELAQNEQYQRWGPGSTASAETYRAAKAKCEDLAEAWETLRNIHDDGTAFLDPAPGILRFKTSDLRLVHRSYRRKWLEWNSVMRVGAFARDVAAAMARMPRAPRLCITDTRSHYGLDWGSEQLQLVAPFIHPRVQTFEAVAKCIATRVTVQSPGRAEHFDRLHLSLLPDLLTAINATRTSLEGLHVQISAPKTSEQRVPAEQFAKLRAGCKELTTLELRLTGSRAPRQCHFPLLTLTPRLPI